MGGVLVELDALGCIANFKTRAGFETIEDYLNIWHQKGFISDMEEGKLSPEGFCDKAIALSRPGTTAEVIRECFCSLLVRLNPSGIELIKALRGRYDMFVLSNNNPITVEKFHNLLSDAVIPGDEVFKEEFYSCFLHLLKPGREIYEEVIRRVGVEPGEILFIDDSEKNVAAAANAGIRTLLFLPGMDLKEEVLRILE